MSIYVAITRRVHAGREAEFQEALREFMGTSFDHQSVLGASILTPPPGSGSREYGILRVFATERDRDAFYQSPLFKAWEERAREMTEGEPVYRQLHGLEAWFRSSQGPPPPRWKMALVTTLGVYPTSLLLSVTVGRWTQAWPIPARIALTALLMVALLTWVIMPQLIRLLQAWLYPHSAKSLPRPK